MILINVKLSIHAIGSCKSIYTVNENNVLLVEECINWQASV